MSDLLSPIEVNYKVTSDYLIHEATQECLKKIAATLARVTAHQLITVNLNRYLGFIGHSDRDSVQKAVGEVCIESGWRIIWGSRNGDAQLVPIDSSDDWRVGDDIGESN